MCSPRTIQDYKKLITTPKPYNGNYVMSPHVSNKIFQNANLIKRGKSPEKDRFLRMDLVAEKFKLMVEIAELKEQVEDCQYDLLESEHVYEQFQTRQIRALEGLKQPELSQIVEYKRVFANRIKELTDEITVLDQQIGFLNSFFSEDMVSRLIEQKMIQDQAYKNLKDELDNINTSAELLLLDLNDEKLSRKIHATMTMKDIYRSHKQQLKELKLEYKNLKKEKEEVDACDPNIPLTQELSRLTKRLKQLKYKKQALERNRDIDLGSICRQNVIPSEVEKDLQRQEQERKERVRFRRMAKELTDRKECQELQKSHGMCDDAPNMFEMTQGKKYKEYREDSSNSGMHQPQSDIHTGYSSDHEKKSYGSGGRLRDSNCDNSLSENFSNNLGDIVHGNEETSKQQRKEQLTKMKTEKLSEKEGSQNLKEQKRVDKNKAMIESYDMNEFNESMNKKKEEDHFANKGTKMTRERSSNHDTDGAVCGHPDSYNDGRRSGSGCHTSTDACNYSSSFQFESGITDSGKHNYSSSAEHPSPVHGSSSANHPTHHTPSTNAHGGSNEHSYSDGKDDFDYWSDDEHADERKDDEIKAKKNDINTYGESVQSERLTTTNKAESVYENNDESILKPSNTGDKEGNNFSDSLNTENTTKGGESNFIDEEMNSDKDNEGSRIRSCTESNPPNTSLGNNVKSEGSEWEEEGLSGGGTAQQKLDADVGGSNPVKAESETNVKFLDTTENKPAVLSHIGGTTPPRNAGSERNGENAFSSNSSSFSSPSSERNIGSRNSKDGVDNSEFSRMIDANADRLLNMSKKSSNSDNNLTDNDSKDFEYSDGLDFPDDGQNEMF